MSTHSVSDQLQFSVQWFRTWSDLQKEDFVQVLTQKLSPAATVTVNGLVNGLQNLDTSGRPPSLFACQVKLFSEWWDTWNEEERGKLTSQLKDSDAKFWSSVEGELDGSRKKREEDFFTVDPVSVSVITSEHSAEAPVESVHNGENSTVVAVTNGVDDVVQVSVVAASEFDQEIAESGKAVTNIEITGNEDNATAPENLGDETERQPEIV